MRSDHTPDPRTEDKQQVAALSRARLPRDPAGLVVPAEVLARSNGLLFSILNILVVASGHSHHNFTSRLSSPMVAAASRIMASVVARVALSMAARGGRRAWSLDAYYVFSSLVPSSQIMRLRIFLDRRCALQIKV